MRGFVGINARGGAQGELALLRHHSPVVLPLHVEHAEQKAHYQQAEPFGEGDTDLDRVVRGTRGCRNRRHIGITCQYARPGAQKARVGRAVFSCIGIVTINHVGRFNDCSVPGQRINREEAINATQRNIQPG